MCSKTRHSVKIVDCSLFHLYFNLHITSLAQFGFIPRTYSGMELVNQFHDFIVQRLACLSPTDLTPSVLHSLTGRAMPLPNSNVVHSVAHCALSRGILTFYPQAQKWPFICLLHLNRCQCLVVSQLLVACLHLDVIEGVHGVLILPSNCCYVGTWETENWHCSHLPLALCFKDFQNQS